MLHTPSDPAAATMVRITTWNVNGIRNPFGYEPWRNSRSFSVMFDILEADIVVFQELKIQRKDLKDDMVLIPGWDCFFSLPKHKKGTRLGLVLLTSRVNHMAQDTLAWQSIQGNQSALPSVQRRVC